MMSDDQTLFRAICFAPWDDLPRLVYADWLDEFGDSARAELIRIQCELPTLSTDDSRRQVIITRQNQLIREHSRRWSAELLEIPFVQWSSHYIRGFCNSAILQQGWGVEQRWELLFQVVPLQRLVIYSLHDEMFRELLGWPGMEQIESLSLPDCQIAQTTLIQLFQSRHLERLALINLRESHFDGEELPAILETSELPRLERVLVEWSDLNPHQLAVDDALIRLRRS